MPSSSEQARAECPRLSPLLRQAKRRCLSSNTISPAVVLRASFAVDSSSTRPCTNIAALAAKATGGLPGKVMMEDYKLNINWLLVPELYRCIGTTRSGKHFDLTLPVGIDNIIDVMEKTVPGSREPMKVFFDLAKECVDAHDYFPITSSTSLTKTIWSKWTACFISNAFPTSCVLPKDRSMRF